MATATLRPNGGAAGDWAIVGGGGTVWDVIDDDPDSPNTTDYLGHQATPSGSATIALTSPTGVLRATNAELRVYGVTGSSVVSNPSFNMRLLQADNTVITTVDFPEGTAESLRTASAAISLPQAEVDGLKLSLTAVSGVGVENQARRCYAAEVVLTYTVGGMGMLSGVG